MARTSKKKQTNFLSTENSMTSKKYMVGIYARLSVDGGEQKNESIETQIKIITAFVNSQDDMVIFDCYVDLGKSGTNFERKEFERLIKDAQMHNINCIIVKDLSRFGRNHIEAGYYIENIFPMMGVRFIALAEHFDNRNKKNKMENIHLKNLVNEMYAKDISLKITSSKKIKWEQGSFIGGIAPYGYKARWIDNKKCLFPEEITSEIVKKIFELFISGKTEKEIVLWLYENRVLKPSEYHKTRKIYCPDGEILQQWSSASVKLLLTNPVYIGCLAKKESNKKDYMMREKYDMDSKNQFIKKHTHEPLVEESLFFQVAAKFQKTSKQKNTNLKILPLEEDIFQNILFCGDCKTKMKRISAIKQCSSENKLRKYSYNCPKISRIDEKKCITKSISLQELSKIVKEVLDLEFRLSERCLEQLKETNSKEITYQKKKWKQKLLEQKRKIENMKKLGSEQYYKFRMGILNEELFKHLKEENQKKILIYQESYADIIKKLQILEDRTIKEEEKLTAELLKILIDRIEIYANHRIVIIFKCKRA